MKKQKKRFLLLFSLLILAFFFENVPVQAKKVYTISPGSKPYNKKVMGYRTYNAKTRQYHTILSYLTQLEKDGGGTLILKKGTYTISNTLNIPSNVTIRFKNGVILKKGKSAGNIIPALTIFQTVRPSRSRKKGIYGGYGGEKNIRLIGEGKVVIDMGYYEDGVGIAIGHTQNIQIKNICFKNMYSGHFIELDASKNVTIDNCKFIDAKVYKENKGKEAINIDTPDRVTKGWTLEWSKFDCTPNRDVIIKNCLFQNLERSVGTHKYSDGRYHTNIKLLNNQIINMTTDAVRVMNWKDFLIQGNTIKNVAPNDSIGVYYAILMKGAVNPSVRNNYIENSMRSIAIMPSKNEGVGSKYKINYSRVSSKNEQDLANNLIYRVVQPGIKIYPLYKDYNNWTLIEEKKKL